MKGYTNIVGVFILLVAVSSEVVKYHGHSVLRVMPQTDKQLKTIRTLLKDAQLDVWKDPRFVSTPVDIRLGPEQLEEWVTLLKNEGLDVQVLIPDVQELIDETTRLNPPLQNPRDLDTARYYNLPEIWEFLDEKVEQCAGLCEVINIGSSYEGRDLKVIKIGSTDADNDLSIWIDNGMHGREWIGPAVGMYIIERLIADLGVDQEVDTLREGFNFYIEPVFNVDGYEYTNTTDRLWRKNLADYGGGECIGVDLDRNFGHEWGGNGSSDNPCSQLYRGPSPFSEPETKAVEDFLAPRADDFRLVYTYHAFGGFMLYPWGYTSEDIPDLEAFLAMAELHIDAVNSVHDYGYTYTSSMFSSGNINDWAYGSLGIKYTFFMELRDDGEYGFLLPPEQILPTDEENWAGIKALALAILAEE